MPKAFAVGDTLIMKKKHPCGADRMLVWRLGSDVGVQCVGCGHRMMVQRSKLEKNILSVESKSEE